MGSLVDDEKTCWVTLVTRPSYLPGVVILAHTLNTHHSRYPLLVQFTASLGPAGIKTLLSEARQNPRIIPQQVDLLLPPKGNENEGSVAERFQDTFTKLRAFEIYKVGYTQACLLDADMAVFQNPDSIFDTQLPALGWIAASHACVCNLDSDPWAPSDWHKGNCAFTLLTNPSQIANDAISRPTYRLLNSGLIYFKPTEELWNRMLSFFNTTDKLRSYKLPDQDFLADFFMNKWLPVSWKYNARKTMKYIHPNLWSETELVVLHYIVDKPWERRVSAEGVAGHLGRDGDTHSWWWNSYNEWLSLRPMDDEVVMMMTKLVGQKEPFTQVVPLPQKPGEPEDTTRLVK